ncbi:MAG: ClpXP protease specificity-enhancing factor [Leptothrix sp. (in: b-proteobacteria)]
MMPPASIDAQGTSTRPYLIRALHEWCTDNGFTPYLAVHVDASVRVPMEYVKNHEIVLNVGLDATSGLRLGNEFVEFKARFGGVARDILVPIDHVIAIYARENGQGMAFPVPALGDRDESADAPAGDGGPATAAPVTGLRLATPPAAESQAVDAADADDTPEPEPPTPAPTGRPSLKRVK